jgi:hypothetical protein
LLICGGFEVARCVVRTAILDLAHMDEQAFRDLERIHGGLVLSVYFKIISSLRISGSYGRARFPGIALDLQTTLDKVAAIAEGMVAYELLYWEGDQLRSPWIDGEIESSSKQKNGYRNRRSASGVNPGSTPVEPCSRSVSQSVSKSGGAGGEPKAPPEPGTVRIGKHVEISEVDLEQYTVGKGAEFIARANEIINGWVEDTSDPLERQEREKRARNAPALYQNWVFNRVHQEQLQAERSKGKQQKAGKPVQDGPALGRFKPFTGEEPWNPIQPPTAKGASGGTSKPAPKKTTTTTRQCSSAALVASSKKPSTATASSASCPSRSSSKSARNIIVG